MRRRIRTLLVTCLATTLPPSLALFAQDTPKKKGRPSEEINKQFRDPDLDVQRFVERFESESREVAAKRPEVLALCGLKPGMGVADIGAGTGLYTFPFAEMVGPEGVVYAVEISPGFLKYLERQAEKRGLAKVVKPIKGAQDTTHLPAKSVDLVFICDAYHHFEKPMPMLASMHQALKPGGRVLIIDFDKAKEGASDFVKGHARAEKEVYFQEFEAAGFERVDLPEVPAFKDNFLAMFRRVDKPASP
jgi:ubiquinone/menaquinone biosynthesis C-methylase UbiE